jgi:hypothetical protein
MDDTQPGTASTPPGVTPPDDVSFGEFARHLGGFAGAWWRLLASEAALARVNLSHLLLGALLLPAIALASVVAVDAALAALLFELTHHWLLAVGVVALLDIAALLGLLWLLRSWWRTLSLPHSRQALTRLWRNHDPENDLAQREGTPARRPI